MLSRRLETADHPNVETVEWAKEMLPSSVDPTMGIITRRRDNASPEAS